MALGSTWLAVGLALIPAAALADGDADAGKKVFNQCAVCHSIKDQSRRIGPTLNGVVGRTAGTVEGFSYSEAMREAGDDGLVWTEDEIAAYVADPRGKIPGNSMAFAGIKDAGNVADVIAYIKTFSPDAD